ncbi:MAG: hypothetical protein JXI43_09510 [Tissierellales bacterium]|nr:hypothetical protein [Tissierellales bacterium]
MIVLVPVTRFRIKYELAEGLPYSNLERLLLEAVNEDFTSLEGLVSNFKLHPRLIVQSLITLTQAGWLALGKSSEQQFVLTSAGRKALEKEDLPEWREIIPRMIYVLLDCVTGTVILEGQVQYVSKWLLQQKNLWDKKACLRTEIFDGKLDESEVYHLLPRKQGQRLHWVGPIEMVGKFSHYLVVEVNPNSGRILNLPPRLERNLRLPLIDKAFELQERAGEVFEKADIEPFMRGSRGRKATQEGQQRDWPIQWDPQNLLFTEEQHITLLKHVFNHADSIIYIASTFIDVQKLEQMKPFITNALERGVDIHFLRGHKCTKESLQGIKKIAYDTSQKGTKGNISVNSIISPSDIRMILWDLGEEHFQAVIGAYDWFGRPLEIEGLKSVGIKVEHPAIISALSRCAASIWENSPSEKFSSVHHRWNEIAFMLEKYFSDAEPEHQFDEYETSIRIVFNREIPILLNEWVASAQSQLLIITDDMCQKIPNCLLSLKKRMNTYNSFEGKIICRRDIDEEFSHEESELKDFIAYTSEIIANMIVSDLSVCITSSSLLAPPQREEKAIRNVGIIVEGSAPVEQIINYFGE